MPNFTIQQGEPWARRIRVALPVGRDYWLDVADFEVLAHVRAGKSATSELRSDLTPFLATSIDGTDVLIDWEMTGADTRALTSGYYDLILSDPGTTDARAHIILAGQISTLPIVTAASA